MTHVVINSILLLLTTMIKMLMTVVMFVVGVQSVIATVRRQWIAAAAC